MQRHTQKFMKILIENAEDLLDNPLAVLYECIEKTLPSNMREKDFFEAFDSLESIGLETIKNLKKEVFYH